MTPIPDEAVEALKPCPLCDGAMHLGADYDGDPMWSHPSDAGGCPLGVVHIYAWDTKAIELWNRRAPHLVPDKGEVGAEPVGYMRASDVKPDLPITGFGAAYEKHRDWTVPLYLKPLPPERGGEDRVAELERELAEALHWKGVWKANATEVIGQRDAAEAELHRLKSADHSTGNMVVKELVDELRDGLNVTDEELLRIRNSAEKDGDVKIWARMLQKIVDHVRRLRAARVQDGWPSVEETARAMAADSRAWREAGYAPDMASALVPGNRGETALASPPLSQPRAEVIDNAIAAAARNDALEAAALTCRDVGAIEAERLIRSMLRTVAPPASAYDSGASGAIRICPERDGPCLFGMSCPYTIDRYSCSPDRFAPTQKGGE